MRKSYWVCWTVGSCLLACGGGKSSGTEGSGGAGSSVVPDRAGSSAISIDGHDAGDECNAFRADPLPNFVACGGNPLGLWRATALEAKGFSFGITHSGTNGSTTTQCSTQVIEEPTLGTFLIALDLQGNMQIRADMSAFQFEVDAGCVERGTAGLTCAALQGFDCETDCGVCSCTYPAIHDLDTLSFELTETTITVGNPLTAEPMPFCVRDGQLHLRFPDGEQLTFEPVQRAGLPEDCSRLSLEVCVNTAGCAPGSCGSNLVQCRPAFTKESCELEALCKWTEELCSGKATMGCSFANYGVKPGCKLVPRSAKCIGDAKPACTTYTTKESCKATAGCQLSAGCTGTSSCTIYNGACSICDATPGCSCNSFGGCGGEIICNGTDESDCTYFSGCTWNAFQCKGTPVQCSDLDLDNCTQVPGCTVNPGE